jgi:hypothetical protein
MRWNDNDVETLETFLLLGLKYEEIADSFGISSKAVKLKTYKLNLKYEPEFYKVYYCKKCGIKFTGRRCDESIFCGRSCSASYTNGEVPKRKKITNNCKECGGTCSRRAAKFCSNVCYQKHRLFHNLTLWLDGKIEGHCGQNLSVRGWVRGYLKESRGSACSLCGWDEVHPVDGKSLTEIDHIDGDAANSIPENLRILCPNCHSMTPTFRARNKNSPRDRR